MKDDDSCTVCGTTGCGNPLHRRLSQWRQPFVCPLCGVEECRHPWHILRLMTRGDWELRPRQFLFLYGLLFMAMTLGIAFYTLVRMAIRG